MPLEPSKQAILMIPPVMHCDDEVGSEYCAAIMMTKDVASSAE
jgi:hypothetical protein